MKMKKLKNIHRNDFVVELSYHTKIRKKIVTMDMLNFTPKHKKGQHLTREERYYISIRLNVDHWSVYKIAKELHRPYNTINKEVKSVTVYLYNGKVKRYKPDIAEQFSP